MQVVETHGNGPERGEVFDQVEDRFEDLVAEGRPPLPGSCDVVAGPEEPSDLRPPWIRGLRSEPQSRGDWAEGAVSLQLLTGPECNLEPASLRETERFPEQARLPDSRFALDQGHRSPPGAGLLDQPAKRLHLPLAAHQR